MWGKETIINLHEIKNPTVSELKRYVEELCELIEMVPYGKPLIPYFGNSFTKGYSLVQLIETSSITGHFAEESKSAYINIFSCKDYDEVAASEFTKHFFCAKDMEVAILKRK